MNDHPAGLENASEQEASLWAARLDGGEMNWEARRDLDIWLASDPSHRSLLARYCQLSVDLEGALADLEVEAAADRQTGAIEPEPRNRNRTARPWAWAAGGAAAAAVVIALFRFIPFPDSGAATYSTPASGTLVVALDEGTRIELNALTRLSVVLRESERRVRLLEGEAFFTVSSDPARPFYVDTAAGSVRVTGTQFNVSLADPSHLEVIVAEGSVQLSAATSGGSPEVVDLGPGERGISTAGAIALDRLGDAAVMRALAWRQRRIELNGLTLGDAVRIFGRFHGRNVEVSPGAAGLAPGGSRSLDDLDGFIEEEAGLFNLRVDRVGDTIRIRLQNEP